MGTDGLCIRMMFSLSTTMAFSAILSRLNNSKDYLFTLMFLDKDGTIAMF